MRRISPLIRNGRGAASVELALTLPVFLLILFGVVETGHVVWMKAAIQSGAQQAARCSAIGSSSCSTVSATQAYAAARSYGLNPSASVFTVTTPSCGKQVDASYVYRSPVSAIIPYNFTLTAKSCYPIAPTS